MKIYGDTRSGNCLKVLYTARKLGIHHDWIDVDIMSGGAKTPAFLAVNPSGQVPAVTLDDGRSLGQSNAIILYLARGSELLPADPYDRAKVDEWLFWEQYSHEPYVAVCRFQMVYEGKPADQREPWRVEKAEAALDRMEDHLADREWLVGAGITVADISLFGYTRLAEEGGFDLTERPALRTWIARCEAALGLA
jgi:glutathione S-transferase